ncbi:unnamed protein product [Allacma fusca]|uniref:Ricin B lectin domain-containing protein n=1 Tax=Allacma fusca TaxID=39272 RepID=A0A8J2PB55_9HEXA|nr:unnamed protein product [Allacma fusca]
MRFYWGKVNTFLPAFLIASCGYLIPGSFGSDELTELENHAVHTFQNRHDLGFLTAITLKTSYAPIVQDIWRDMASQKWRVVKAYFSKSYQLRSVSSNDEKLMELDLTTGRVYQDTVGVGLGNSQYWQMIYVGHGYHVIKNYKTGDCLESSGLGEPVRVSPCTSIPRQQWAIHSL